ncbi:hypothetical protein ACTHGU_13290 [Chitinophagaceae bacterium MMS25-I14]
MKKNVTITTMAMIAACAGLFSCHKTSTQQTAKPAAREVRSSGMPPEAYTDYIISNDGYCPTCIENIHATLNVNTLNPSYSNAENITGFFGSTTGMKGYAEWNGIKALTYGDAQNNNKPMLRILAHPNGAMLGSFPLVSASGGGMFVEEIEVNPADNNIYALAANGFSKAIYRIDVQNGVAQTTLIGNVFANAAVNGYLSGSIAFVQDQTTLQWRLAFTHESSLGLLTWNYIISNGALSGDHYHGDETHTGVSKMYTGKINTVSFYGRLYLARDYDTLYSLVPGGGTATAQPGGVIDAANDFAPRPAIFW